MQCATCDPNDDCTCDQDEHTTLNRYGYHLQDADDQRGYWYALGVQTGVGRLARLSKHDHESAAIQRALREYGYK